MKTLDALVDWSAVDRLIEGGARPAWRGRVELVSGVLVEATGVPAAVGELCLIDRGPAGAIEAEVVGFRGSATLLMPHGSVEGIGPKNLVTALGHPFMVPVGDELLGRVVDGFGRPLDAGPALRRSMKRRRVQEPAPDPLGREPISEKLQTGVRTIDGLLSVGKGQRLGIFSGSGVGKSSLLGQITRGTDADAIVVALVGERGREVRAFLDDVLGEEGRSRAVTVVATSDRPPIERFLAPFVAVTMAESLRDQGQDVLFVMDSITRFAAASREIGLAAGEPPTIRGYPPSFFATVPRLVERLGRSGRGSITGLITVLLEGDDMNEPVADTLRGLLDGHLVLSRDLAMRGRYPAIDVLGSLSRLMGAVATPEHVALATQVRQVLADWAEGRDLVEIGAYKSGANPKLDRALRLLPAIETFMAQDIDETTSFEESVEFLGLILQEGLS